jgi:hypothetical protein
MMAHNTYAEVADAWDHIYALGPQRAEGAFLAIGMSLGTVTVKRYQDWVREGFLKDAPDQQRWTTLQEIDQATSLTKMELKEKGVTF